MRLENQVCSLELAKSLKELGVNKPSIFGWVHHNFGDKKEWIIIKGTNDLKPMNWGDNHCKLQEQKDKEISAFTVAELGEMIPSFVELSKVENIKIATIYSEDNGTESNVSFIDDTEANVRAKILIYLLQNNITSHS